MQLQRLHTTACLTIFYHAAQNWLFLEWRGELTLPNVQEACVAVATCYLPRTYQRVLTSHLRVTRLEGQVATWLSQEFLPYLAVIGVEQVAWLSAPSVAGCHLAHTLRQRVPGLVLNWFETNEQALAWLQQPRVPQLGAAREPASSPLTHVRLAQGVEVLRQEAHLIRQEVQQLQQKVRRRPLKTWQS